MLTSDFLDALENSVPHCSAEEADTRHASISGQVEQRRQGSRQAKCPTGTIARIAICHPSRLHDSAWGGKRRVVGRRGPRRILCVADGRAVKISRLHSARERSSRCGDPTNASSMRVVQHQPTAELSRSRTRTHLHLGRHLVIVGTRVDHAVGLGNILIQLCHDSKLRRGVLACRSILVERRFGHRVVGRCTKGERHECRARGG
mmetsp:Transcript_11235/g.34612  ORF Transcript_11235/g.34612 Transcript_11235/m.34612 type:complete len:204 (+) Transcript_11235:875-1486(+)